MPYRPEHKVETRARIVECARGLFNRRGFTDVPIDDIMAEAGLTRGGFYNHFRTKGELYAETMSAYAKRRENENEQRQGLGPDVARRIVEAYVSRQHLDNVDGHCPLMGLPSDAARGGSEVKAAYGRVLEAMVSAFESSIHAQDRESARQKALAITASCVGAMVLARTIEDDDLADEICEAARIHAFAAIG